MRLMKKPVMMIMLATALFCGMSLPAHGGLLSATSSPVQGELLVNGTFENGTTGWTKTQGYFAVAEYPDASNHVALLRGASGYTSEIVQTINNLTPGKYAIYVETQGFSSCTTTATGESGGQSSSGSVPSNYSNNGGPALTVDFCVPAGASSATIRLSVTGSGGGRNIRIDNAFVVYLGICG